MKCPVCGKAAVIRKGEDIKENEINYRVLHYFCINRKCGNYGKETGIVKNRL